MIGLWHRHPGSFDQFSSTDDGTNAKYASMRKEGAISALVNLDPSFRITMYQVCRPCRYKRIAYEVGDNLIPDGLLKFKSPDKFFSIMDGILRKPEAVENVIRIKEIYSLIHLEKQKPNVIKKSSEKLLTWLALLYE